MARRRGNTAKQHEPTLKPPREVEQYLHMIETDKPFLFCKDQKKLAKLVRKAFAKGDIYVNRQQFNAYLAIGNAMFPKLFPWQKFLCCLLLCTYRCKDDRPRWKHGLVMLARGAGKDGVIAWFALCLTSKNNPVPNYDVDICANDEDQSLRPVKEYPQYKYSIWVDVDGKKVRNLWSLCNDCHEEIEGRKNGRYSYKKKKEDDFTNEERWD